MQRLINDIFNPETEKMDGVPIFADDGKPDIQKNMAELASAMRQATPQFMDNLFNTDTNQMIGADELNSSGEEGLVSRQEAQSTVSMPLLVQQLHSLVERNGLSTVLAALETVCKDNSSTLWPHAHETNAPMYWFSVSEDLEVARLYAEKKGLG